MFCVLGEAVVEKTARTDTVWCTSLTLLAGCQHLPCACLGWDTASATLGLLVRPAHWAVLGRTLASSRVKHIRELLIGLSLWEEARSQLAA